MSQTQYSDKNTLKRFLYNSKNMFSPLSHSHTTNDVIIDTGETLTNKLENMEISKIVQGETIVAENCANVKPKNIKLFGKGKQRQYEGNQMLEKFTGSGMNSTLSDDGLSIVSEAKSGENYINMLNGDFNPMQLLAGKTYYVSMDIKLVSGSLTKINSIQLMDSSSTTIKTQTDMLKPSISASYQRYAIKVDAETDAEATKIYVQGYVGTDAVVEITNVMISESTYEWEPYVGNEPSPNMKYPQKVTPIGERGCIGGTLFAGNTIPPTTSKSITSNGITFDVLEDGVVHAHGTSTGNAEFNYIGGWMQETGVSISKGFKISKKIDGVTINMYGYNDAVSYEHISSTDNSGYSDVSVMLNIGAGYTVDCYVRPYACKEEILTDYAEPQPFTSQTPNGLRGIPLGQTIPDVIKNSPIHMSGVYWDGEQYQIADTENEDGKDVQRIGKIIATSNSIIQDMSVYTGALSTVANFRFAGSGTKGIKNTHVMSEKLLGKPCWGNDYECCWHVEANGIDFNIKYEHLGITSDATKEERENAMKTWLDSNELAFYHILAEPIITDTTEEEKAQLDALLMNYPNTTVVNDAGAYMEVEYYLNTNNAKEILNIMDTMPDEYVHPTHNTYTAGFYKIEVDNLGHIKSATPVTKEDIINLGIPDGEHLESDSLKTNSILLGNAATITYDEENKRMVFSVIGVD